MTETNTSRDKHAHRASMHLAGAIDQLVNAHTQTLLVNATRDDVRDQTYHRASIQIANALALIRGVAARLERK